MTNTIKELAALVAGEICGDGDLVITGIGNIDNAKVGDIIFIDNPKYLAMALASGASAIVAPLGTVANKPLILVKHPKLAFAKIINQILPPLKPPVGIDSSALVAATVQYGAGISIGPQTIIEAGTTIGNNVQIGARAVIGANVEIGDDCIIDANVTIYHHVKIGNRVIIHAGTVIGSDGFGYVPANGRYHKFPQIGDVIIEDDVEIGSNSSIDRGALASTIIGQGTKIDNLVQIAHNVKIGKNCILAAQVGISGSAVLEDNVILGGQVGIADHVRIETGAIVGAQAGVPTGKIIRRDTLVWGTPARPMAEFKRVYVHTQNLPTLKARLIELEQKVATLLAKDTLDKTQ